MTNCVEYGNLWARKSWSWRTSSCSAPANIYRIPRKESPIRRIYPNPISLNAVGIFPLGLAPAAVNVAGARNFSRENCTTSATSSAADRVKSISPTRSTSAVSAASISTPTCPTSPHPRLTTRIASWAWRFASSPRTVCHTRQPVGTSGVTIAFSSPGQPSKTGWRRGEKKAARQIENTYLDWALADFSGYIAADELYDGPFCILSIVDNHTFKRIIYQVLDHDPTHKDIVAFFDRFQAALKLRRLKLEGTTTDASPLYPEPLREVFGDVP